MPKQVFVPPQALVLKEKPTMRLSHWLVPITLFIAAIGAGWKWEQFPH